VTRKTQAKAPVIDRRVQKTRQSLHGALISLILEKGYDTVTVQDIIDRANVGRSTFYAHYPSKEDLLQGGFDELRKLLIAGQSLAGPRTDSRRLGFSLALFEHAQGYREVYRALIGRQSGGVVIAPLRQLMTELVSKEVQAGVNNRGGHDIPRTAVIEYLVGALLSVLTWWLDEKTPVPPRDADAIFRRLALRSVFPE
jgi:AcrR family transcriptional regulator